jgi:hypothetical protein
VKSEEKCGCGYAAPSTLLCLVPTVSYAVATYAERSALGAGVHGHGRLSIPLAGRLSEASGSSGMVERGCGEWCAVRRVAPSGMPPFSRPPDRLPQDMQLGGDLVRVWHGDTRVGGAGVR